jgi:hypothetical protein
MTTSSQVSDSVPLHRRGFALDVADERSRGFTANDDPHGRYPWPGAHVDGIA